MNDYDYENGEEYQEAQDSGFAEMAEKAFRAIGNMPIDKPMDWKDVCSEYFGLPVPEKKDNGEWALHLAARNAMKGAINYRAKTLGRPWRLYIHINGKSVVKIEKERMIEHEVTDRLSRVASSYSLTEKNLTPILAVDGLTSRDRRLIREITSIATGARLATIGMVSQLKSIGKKKKKELIYIFDPDIEAADEEDY